MQTDKQIETRLTSELKPYKKNSRTHSDKQIEQVANSIKEWGWTIPILVDEENTVLAGHARLYAAEYLELPKVPCVVATGWSDDQKKAYVIADNKLAENSDWDFSLYYTELKDLNSAGFDLSLTGLTENFSFNFEPNLNPETTYEEVTSVDMDSAAERVGNVGESSAKKIQVMCPNCAHEFEFAGM